MKTPMVRLGTRAYVVFGPDHARELFPDHPNLKAICSCVRGPQKVWVLFLSLDSEDWEVMSINNAPQLQLNRRTKR